MPRKQTEPNRALLVAFGENVRRARKRKGLTQEKLAELVDLHPRVVQKIESGKTNLLVTTLVRIQAALGCTFEALMPTPNPVMDVDSWAELLKHSTNPELQSLRRFLFPTDAEAPDGAAKRRKHDVRTG